MILSCPSCSAQYFADDKAIGENGRTVRCAACGHSWFAKPELSLEQKFSESDLSREKVERIRQEQDAPALPPHQAYREKEFAKRTQGSRVAALAAWTGSAAIFFGLGAGAVINRDDVVKHWPQASSAYAMVGLDVNRFGLEFGPVDAKRTFEGTTPILTLSGAVLNTSGKFQAVPTVRIDLRDDHGNDVDSLLITLEATALEPGGQARFETRIDDPPLDAFDLAMSFVQGDEHRIAAAATTQEDHAADGHGDTGHVETPHATEAEHHAPAEDSHAAPDTHGEADAHHAAEEVVDSHADTGHDSGHDDTGHH